MKIIRKSSESEMILNFLQSEITSQRFRKRLYEALEKLNLSEDIIKKGDYLSVEQNKLRLNLMKVFRGFQGEDVFVNFPIVDVWKYVELSENDMENIFYLDYSYWNKISNNTSRPTEAVKVINSGVDIEHGLSYKTFIDGKKYLNKGKFEPVILLTCNGEKYVIIEGHSRMTIYAFEPNTLNGTNAFVGYCSEEEMRNYDIRMLANEKVEPRMEQ